MTLQSLDYATQPHSRRRRAAWWVTGVVALAALAGWRVSEWWNRRESLRQAQLAAAKATVATLDAAVDRFELDAGRFPTTAEGLNALVQPPPGVRKWNGPYLRRAPLADPWGKPYSYSEARGVYRVTSAGPDGKPGTGDDIVASGPAVKSGSPGSK